MAQKFYCIHCGISTPSVSSLTAGYCSRNPYGSKKHVLYQGSEKSQYTCKHCGVQFATISSMTAATCFRHPDGAHKGRHEPAL